MDHRDKPGDDALIAVQGTANTAVYHYQENGAKVDNVSADELTLLAVAEDEHLTATDFITG